MKNSFKQRTWVFFENFCNVRNPYTLTFVLALTLLLLVNLVSWHYYFSRKDDFIVQLLAEFHGTVVDIIVLGILMVWINRLSEKRKTIDHCRQELNDLRTIRGKIVVIKIISCIKTLNRYGVFEMDLSRISLPNAPLSKAHFINSNLNSFLCHKGSLVDSIFSNCSMNAARFDDADLFQVEMVNVVANGASFISANLSKAKLENSKFITANFKRAYLNGASFRGSNLLGVNFEGAHLCSVDFRECRELTLKQLMNAKIVSDCLFDPDLQEFAPRIGKFNTEAEALSFGRPGPLMQVQRAG